MLKIKNHEDLLYKVKKGKLRPVQMDSRVLLIPWEFKYLDIGTPYQKCKYAGVVANRLAEKMDIPFFVFFHNFRYPSHEFYSSIYRKLAKHYPRYHELRALEVDVDAARGPISDEDYERYWHSPEYGIFRIPDEEYINDRLFREPSYHAPYDAVILQSYKDIETLCRTLQKFRKER